VVNIDLCRLRIYPEKGRAKLRFRMESRSEYNKKIFNWQEITHGLAITKVQRLQVRVLIQEAMPHRLTINASSG
jgi:hypothetical protein